MSETIKFDSGKTVPEYQVDARGNAHGRDGSAIINTVGTETGNPTRLQVPLLIGPYEGSSHPGEQPPSAEPVHPPLVKE